MDQSSQDSDPSSSREGLRMRSTGASRDEVERACKRCRRVAVGYGQSAGSELRYCQAARGKSKRIELEFVVDLSPLPSPSSPSVHRRASSLLVINTSSTASEPQSQAQSCFRMASGAPRPSQRSPQSFDPSEPRRPQLVVPYAFPHSATLIKASGESDGIQQAALRS